MRGKLNRDPHAHDQVYQTDSVQSYSPQIHQAKHISGYHGNGDGDDQGGSQVESQQDKGHDEHRHDAEEEVDDGLVSYGKVLLVEEIENGVRVNRHVCYLG